MKAMSLSASFVATVLSAVTVAGPLDDLLPRPKEVRNAASGSLSCEGLPSGVYALCVRGGKAEIAAVEDRVADFEEVWLAPDIDLVMCAGGGVGCEEIVDRLDWDN